MCLPESTTSTPTIGPIRHTRPNRLWRKLSSVITANRRALALAVLQGADLAVTQTSRAYGDEHLDHLGVPRALRPLLPVVKVTATGALIVTSNRPALRRFVGVGLALYYLAAVAFHVRAGDRATQAAPAAFCVLIAVSLV